MKEVKLGRVAGPYDKVPFKNFMQSPIGLVPKSGGRTQLIFHLSYAFKSGKGSLNSNTPDHLCTVKYNDLDYAVKNCLHLSSYLPLFLGKTDVQSAFRVLPLKPSQVKWCVIMAHHPITNKKSYFLDLNLPFGASISCNLFQEFSTSLKHIVEFLSGKRFSITNYLDDFLFIDTTQQGCDQLVRLFIEMCNQIGLPISHEKTEWSTQHIVFLGILLDGSNRLMCVPEEKRILTLNLVQWFQSKRKATVKSLQSLTGHLNFLNKAIYPGRAFTRRMYAKFAPKTGLSTNKQLKGKLKQHHHVRLDKEFKLDCEVWVEFLSDPHSVSRPFIDLNRKLSAEKLNFYTDAAAGRSRGAGCVLGRNCVFLKWEPGFIRQNRPSIEFLELYAVCIGVFTWSHKLANKRFVLRCDNRGVCFMVNNSTSSKKDCMYLIRMLVMRCMQYNMRVFLKWVKGSRNILADVLSRQKLLLFRKYAPANMKAHPDQLPIELWPLSSLWSNMKLTCV